MFKFLREVFSDDGQGSFSRVSEGVIVLAVVSWVSFVVWKNHAIPDLTGPTMFLSTSATALYGIGKIAGAFQAAKNGITKKDDTPAPPAA